QNQSRQLGADAVAPEDHRHRAGRRRAAGHLALHNHQAGRRLDQAGLQRRFMETGQERIRDRRHHGRHHRYNLADLRHLAATAHAWQMKQAALMTDWAQQVDTNSPLPEYPRPQMARTNWLNLNGIWQFQAGNTNDPVPTNQVLASEILVPFPIESAISGVKQYYARSWYRRMFTVPPAWSGQRILLHLDAVDWE